MVKLGGPVTVKLDALQVQKKVDAFHRRDRRVAAEGLTARRARAKEPTSYVGKGPGMFPSSNCPDT